MAPENQAQGSSGRVYVEEDKKGIESWYCEWYDHAGRLIRKKIGPKSLIKTKKTARRRAALIASEIIAEHEVQLELKHTASTRELWEAERKASFPRAVVAARVEAICDRIARVEAVDDDRRAGRPGMQLFSERTGISPRQVHRILEDETYIGVGTGIVDRICTQFEDLMDDFIAEATDWAVQRGNWKTRPGSEDSWPFGYDNESSGSKKPGASPKPGQDVEDWQREVREYERDLALAEMFG